MDHDRLKQLVCDEIVVGFNETKKTVRRGELDFVVIALDVESGMAAELEALCAAQGVPVARASSRKELGELCEIEVGASVVGHIRRVAEEA